jgi:hypothetical protein
MSGAKLSQTPTMQHIQMLTGRLGRSARHPKMTSRMPETMSLQVMAAIRAGSESQMERPPLGWETPVSCPSVAGAKIIQNPKRMSVQYTHSVCL